MQNSVGNVFFDGYRSHRVDENFSRTLKRRRIFQVSAVNRQVRADISFAIQVSVALESFADKACPCQNFRQSFQTAGNKFIWIFDDWIFKINRILADKRRIQTLGKIIAQFSNQFLRTVAAEKSRINFVHEPLIFIRVRDISGLI